MNTATMLSNPIVKNLIITLAVAGVPVAVGVLSALIGLIAKIPWLPADVKLFVGRVFTSYEAQITAPAVQQFATALVTSKSDLETVAEKAAERMFSLAIQQLCMHPEPATPAIKSEQITQSTESK